MDEITAADVMTFLETKMPEMSTTLELVRIELSTVKACTKQNNRALRGGNSDVGLVAEVKNLSAVQEECRNEIHDIDSLLHKGTGNTPGLVDQVRENREWRKSLKTWYAVFVGAILVGVVNIILELSSRTFLP